MPLKTISGTASRLGYMHMEVLYITMVRVPTKSGIEMRGKSLCIEQERMIDCSIDIQLIEKLLGVIHSPIRSINTHSRGIKITTDQIAYYIPLA